MSFWTDLLPGATGGAITPGEVAIAAGSAGAPTVSTSDGGGSASTTSITVDAEAPAWYATTVGKVGIAVGGLAAIVAAWYFIGRR